jgi:ectoine hydroxylase-related dioxygenase (phytanoyl-CoA dioxygenase family)
MRPTTGQSTLRRPITDAEKAAFARDGAICLRGHFDEGWIARLQQATEELLSQRSLVLEYTLQGNPGRFAYTEFMWCVHPVFHEFVHTSPAAAIAGEVMGATKINLFADQLLVKEPGTLDPTRWHHDLPFWPLAGKMTCSIWLALDPVTRETGGVEYVAGSHRWPVRYRPVPPYTPEMSRKRNMDLPECPSFHELRDRYPLLSWDLSPGDCLVFDVLTIHGSAGNTSSAVRRRGFATRWCGDDVTYVDGDFVLTPLYPPGIATGDPLDSDIFPVIWRRPG